MHLRARGVVHYMLFVNFAAVPVNLMVCACEVATPSQSTERQKQRIARCAKHPTQPRESIVLIDIIRSVEAKSSKARASEFNKAKQCVVPRPKLVTH